MRDPSATTPFVFNYLWLFWFIKQIFPLLPKDLIYEIIGTHKNRYFCFPERTFELFPLWKKLQQCDIDSYYLWLKKPSLKDISAIWEDYQIIPLDVYHSAETKSSVCKKTKFIL
jgi:hypothetical protein